ncbi:MAG TPA: hypothetical protein VGM39_05370 [Kofleriaceae bacterium]|jgi:hypothetical protein
MKLLVAIGDARERKRIVALLVAASHEVTESVIAPVGAGLMGIDVAFVDAAMVGKLRAAPQRIYLIAVVGVASPPSEYASAFTAGADDAMRINAPKEEVCGRAGALARINSWACPPRTVTQRLATIPVWDTIDQIVSTEIGELFGEAVSLEPAETTDVVETSVIPLTLPSQQLQIRIGLGIDVSTLGTLQSTLLGGDTSQSAIADAMREFANTAGGALKRAAFGAGVEFTIGLPSNGNVIAQGASRSQRTWKLRAASGVTFTCIAIASSSAPKVLTIRDLREGMVVARDVHNAVGVLVVPAGTSLTRNTVDQLGRILGAAANVEVNDAAA